LTSTPGAGLATRVPIDGSRAEVTGPRFGDTVAAPARRSRTVVRRLIAVAAFLCLWQIGVDSGVLSPAAIASPTQIAKAAGPVVGSGEYWSAIAHTTRSWALGLGIAVAIAIPAGLLIGSSAVLYDATRVTIDFLRTIPPVVIIPLALLMYGATSSMVIVIIVFGSVWPLLLQAMQGARCVDPMLRDVAATYRIRLRLRALLVVFPSAAPYIATGLRIAATMSLLLAVGAELLGGAPGIGGSIQLAARVPDVPAMYVQIVTAAVIGAGINLVLAKIERVMLPWHAANR
jgi:ABC-type nitrate/sulfonate/bicarbonate transport system permease component